MKEKRFEVKKSQISFSGEPFIITDKTTRVQYLYFRSGPGGGMTVLLDKDGKPLLSN